jgi:succinoglycan biosynthesis protein ExoM
VANAVIAIPTCRRPAGLTQLLDSLAALVTEHEVSVIVADNDADGHEGLSVVGKLQAAGYRWPISAFLVPQRGISQVRNGLVAAATAVAEADYVLMLDDDETAEPGWLDEMIQVQRDTCADVVGGRVNRRFEGGKPSWVEGVSLLANKTGAGGSRVDLVNSTANILFVRSFLARLSLPVFDPAFGLTGGEDKEALMRAKRAGASFAWAERAVVSEQIPASRLTEGWVLKSAFRVGNSDMRVLLRHRRSWMEVLAEIGKAFTVLLGAPALLLRATGNDARRIRARMMIWRAAGKLAAFAGLAYREYRITHGG